MDGGFALPGYSGLVLVHRGRQNLIYRGLADDGARVVVKLGRPELGMRRTPREAALLSSIAIRGVVRARAVIETPHGPALVLDDVGPSTLEAWLGSRLLRIDAFLELAMELTFTLGAVHRAGIIHRGVNPSNLVVSPSGDLTLVDFDLALRAPKAQADAGAFGRFSGTVAYLAPEQTGRMNRTVDHRADLYSLGATFHRILSGGPPFPLGEPGRILHAHLALRPPRLDTLRPEVPAALADIVVRLLEKMPEARYQSAASLLADLEEAHRRHVRTGEIEQFELGRGDAGEAFHVSERRHGGAAELLALTQAFDAAAAGHRVQLTVIGPTGSGKSKLVQALHAIVGERGGRLVFGRVDAQSGAIFGALTPAVSALLSHVSLSHDLPLRAQLEAALGDNLSLLTNTLPEARGLFGDRHGPPPPGPGEASNRLTTTFLRLMRLFATQEFPLALVLEGARRADATTRRLLDALLCDRGIGALLLVCTQRSAAEGGDIEPPGMDAPGLLVHEICLEPLDGAAVAELLAETLGDDAANLRALGATLARKSGGNPLFLRHLLQRLASEGVIRRSADGFTHDLEAIERLPVTDNVGALLAADLGALSPQTLTPLQVAACAGMRAGYLLLGEVLGCPPEAVRESLAPAFAWDLLLATADGDGVIFSHERVQRALLDTLTPARAAELHMRLGYAMSARPDGALAAAAQFDRACMVDPLAVDAQTIAQAHRRAGQAAHAASGYAAAASHLSRAIATLGEGVWADRASGQELHREAAHCAYAAGAEADARRLIGAAMGHTADALERAALVRIHVQGACVRGAWPEAIEAARGVLDELGDTLPTADPRGAFAREATTVATLLGGRPPMDIVDRPAVGDAVAAAALELLGDLTPVFFFWAPELLPWAAARMTALTLRAGIGHGSPMGLAVHGMVLAGALGDRRAGFAFGEAAVALVRRVVDAPGGAPAGSGQTPPARFLIDPVQRCRTLHVIGTHIHHWGAPLRTVEPLLREAFSAGVDGGDPGFAAFAATAQALSAFHAGASLRLVWRELSAAQTFAASGGHRAMLDMLGALHHALVCLRSSPLPDGELDVETWRASLAQNPPAQAMDTLLSLQTAYLMGDLSSARTHLANVNTRARLLTGLFAQAEIPYYAGLLAAAEGDAAALETHLGEVAALSADAPANFEHKALLLRAEHARLSDRIEAAMTAYDAAIEGAAREGFLQDEGLAQHLAAAFYRGLGRHRVASVYARGAGEAWHRWGAPGLAARLRADWPELEAQRAGSDEVGQPPGTNEGSEPDLATVLEAAEAITGEMDLDRLLQKLMTVCVQAAGATRGVLAIEERGIFHVRAVRDAGDVPARLCRVPLAESADVPGALLAEALESGHPLSIDDVLRDAARLRDPYIQARAPRSLLVLPISRHGGRFAVLYVENVLTSHAFSARRIKLLRMLSTEIAISLYNSLLFTELAHESERKERALDALARSNDELETFVHSASHDLKRLARTAASCLELVLEDHAADLDPDVGDLVRRARRATLEVTPLLESLLGYSSIGRQVPLPTRVDVSALASSILAGFRSESPARDVRVLVEPDLWVHADAPLMAGLLGVLLHNAWTYTDERPGAEIRVERVGDRILVRDTGVGFDVRFADKLFKPFQRLHDPRRYRGVGLGLATARRIVERHHGEIGASSPESGGAVFWFRLPGG